MPEWDYGGTVSHHFTRTYKVDNNLSKKSSTDQF